MDVDMQEGGEGGVSAIFQQLSSSHTVILRSGGLTLSNDGFEDLLSSLRHQSCKATASQWKLLSWKRLVIHMPVTPGTRAIMDKSFMSTDAGTTTSTFNLTSEQSIRFLNLVGNQQIEIEELFIVGNNKIDNMVVPLLLGRTPRSSLRKLHWTFSYGRQWPMYQVESLSAALQRQDKLEHLELINLDFLWPVQPEREGCNNRDRPLDVILEALTCTTTSSSCLKKLVVQMKHGSNLRHLIRQSTTTRALSMEPFHTSYALGRFCHRQTQLEHIELLNWNLSDKDCAGIAAGLREHQQQAACGKPLRLRAMTLSHYHQSSCQGENGTNMDGLQALLAICLAPSTPLEILSILPSLPWTRTRSDDDHRSITSGSRQQLEALLLYLLQNNCHVNRLCVTVPGMVMSQSTLSQIELYIKLNKAGRKWWRQTHDNELCRGTWLNLMANMTSSHGPDGQKHSMSTLRYSNDMVFLALKETTHFVKYNSQSGEA